MWGNILVHLPSFSKPLWSLETAPIIFGFNILTFFVLFCGLKYPKLQISVPSVEYYDMIGRISELSGKFWYL
jgi:hypothetical protein